MNWLFAVASTMGTAVVLLLVIPFLPKKKKVRRYAVIGAALIVAVILYINLNTYGARVGVAQTALPSPPEKIEIKSGSEIFGTNNKWESLENAMKKHEEEQAKTLPK